MNILNYEGRFSCKVGTAVANVFLGPIPDEEKAWQFLGAAALAGTSAIVAYEAWKAGKLTYDQYYNKGKLGYWGAIDKSKKNIVRTFAKEFIKNLKKDAIKATRGIVSSIGKMSTKSRVGLIGGALAVLGAIILGKEYVSKIPTVIDAFINILGKIARSAIKLCNPKPIPIAVDYLMQLDCYKSDKYLKEQLTKDAYDALQKLIEEGEIGKCSSNPSDWVELILNVELARAGKMTFEEGLRETELPMPTLHYVVFLENVSALNKDWEFGEAEMICWWNLLRFKGKEDVSYFDEIYGETKEIYDSDSIGSINTEKNLCWKILRKLGKSKEDILTNGEGRNYVAPFSDKDTCTEDIKDCINNNKYSIIKSSNSEGNSVAVHFYHALGRLATYLIYYNVE